MKCLKRFSSLALCLAVMTFHASAASITGGYFGVNDYRNYSLDDRPEKQYVQNLNSEINWLFSSLGHSYTNSYTYTDSSATKSQFITRANSSDAKTLFVFAGHGYQGCTGGPVLYDQKVVKTDLAFKHRYVTMYTCNWLYNGDHQPNKKLY